MLFQRSRNGANSSLETPTILSSGEGSSLVQVLERNMVIGPCPMLFTLIRKSKWKKVRKQLNSKKAYIMCRECDSNGVNALGFAISYNAPIDIVKLILSIDPSQLNAVNRFQTNPLHAACMYCNSLETVRYFMDNAPDLISKLDKDGRTPLHHAVECFCINDEMDAAKGFEVVKALAEADTTLINLADAQKNTPIDMLHLAWADTHPRCDLRQSRISKLHTFLREISIQEYKRKKLIWEDQGFPFDEKVSNDDEQTSSMSSFASRKDSHVSKNGSITVNSSIEAVEEEFKSHTKDGIRSEESTSQIESSIKSVKKIKSVFLLSRKKASQDRMN